MIYYGITDIGMRRVVNQDNFKIKEYPGGVTLAVVCDGMGGANGGATASAVAIEAFVKYIDRFGDLLSVCADNGEDGSLPVQNPDGAKQNKTIPEILSSAVAHANEAVFAMASQNEELAGMGTTLVACLATKDCVYAANVGDSRMYMINGKEALQVTHDHSYVQHLIDTGALSPKKAKNAKNKNIITRAVGTEESVKADVFKVGRSAAADAGSSSYILLCTDGLTNMVEPQVIAKVIRAGGASSVEELKSTAGELVKRANEHGGNDNITVVILSYKG